MDDQLKMRTLLVADRITLADIIICCQLDKAFRLIISQSMRQKLTNLTRWFSFMRQSPPMTARIGKMFLCGESSFRPNFDAPLVIE